MNKIKHYFFPQEPGMLIKEAQKIGKENEPKEIFELNKMVDNIQQEFNAFKVNNWEIVLEGYLEVSDENLPCKWPGFKTTIKISKK